MSEIRKEWDEAPSPVDASIYQASDRPLVMWPYGEGNLSALPVNWATDYLYRLAIFDPADPDNPIFEADGTNNADDGSTSFAIPRATRMGWDWTAQKHDVSEIVGGEVVDAPIAGSFTLLRRGNV